MGDRSSGCVLEQPQEGTIYTVNLLDAHAGRTSGFVTASLMLFLIHLFAVVDLQTATEV